MKKLLHFLLVLSNILLFAQNGHNQNWSQAIELPKSNIDFNSSTSNNNMVILDDGSIFLVYTEANESGSLNLIYFVTSDDGENWSSPELFEPGNLVDDSCCPSIAIDKNNTIHFVWYSNLLKIMYYCNYKDGSFSDALQVNKNTEYNLAKKSITVDRQNRIHIFWQDSETGTNKASEIYYCRSIDYGNSFEGTVLLSEDDGYHSTFPSADFSGTDGDILAIAWIDSSGYLNNTSWDILSAVSLDGGESWEIKPVVTSETRELDAGILVDKNGKLILNYIQQAIGESNNSSVWTSTSSTGGDTWSNPTRLSAENIRSHSNSYNYDYKNNIQWLFWKEERSITTGNLKTNLVGAYSLDAGSNWSDPESIADYRDLNIGIKNAWIGNKGEMGINYEITDSLSELRSIYYQSRSSIQYTKSYKSGKTKNETNWASAYPNPVSSEVTITFRCNSPGEYEVGIFNLLGEKKVTHTKYFETGIGQINFKLSGFLPGIYFYTVVGNGKVVTGKLTKVVF